MTAFTPAIAKPVQGTVDSFPVPRMGVLLSPGLNLFDQGQTLGLVLGGFGANLVKPSFHHLVGRIASFVEFLPQAMVGCSALVGLLP